MMRPAGRSAPSRRRTAASRPTRSPASSVKDAVLAQFGKAGAGGVPMPNIPQMSSVWSDLGGAWVKSTKGAGATKARSPSRPPPRNIAEQDRLEPDRLATRAPGRRAPASSVSPRPEERAEHDRSPHEPPPPAAPELGDRGRWSAPSRLVARLLGHGRVRRQDRRCSRSSTRSRSGPAACSPTTRSGSRSASSSSRRSRSTRSTSGRGRRDPAQVPDPRHGLPDRVPGRPDHLQRQRRLHELLDGTHPLEERGDRRDQAQLARAAGRTARRT